MILGIGIDAVDTKRFAQWHTYPAQSLARIFSAEEIAYCLAHPAQNAQRFAARFAAREALLKALSAAYPTASLALLALCRHTHITHAPSGAPTFTINFQALGIPASICHLSWAHTSSTAHAMVIVEQKRESLGFV